jgi:hypothetical protein
MPLASRSASDGSAAVSSDPAWPVRDVQVRSRVACRELAADRLVSGPCAAPRRDARVVLLLARPLIDAHRAVRVIEPCRVHLAPPATWASRSWISAIRQLLIDLPFNRPQYRGEHGLALGQQLAHVLFVLPGSYVSAHNESPALELPSVLRPPLASRMPDRGLPPGCPAPVPPRRRRARRRCRAGSNLALGGTPAHRRLRGPAPTRWDTGADAGTRFPPARGLFWVAPWPLVVRRPGDRHVRAASSDNRT